MLLGKGGLTPEATSLQDSPYVSCVEFLTLYKSAEGQGPFSWPHVPHRRTPARVTLLRLLTPSTAGQELTQRTWHGAPGPLTLLAWQKGPSPLTRRACQEAPGPLTGRAQQGAPGPLTSRLGGLGRGDRVPSPGGLSRRD